MSRAAVLDEQLDLLAAAAERALRADREGTGAAVARR
jgi:hypothetical protein